MVLQIRSTEETASNRKFSGLSAVGTSVAEQRSCPEVIAHQCCARAGRPQEVLTTAANIKVNLHFAGGWDVATKEVCIRNASSV